MIPMSIIQDVRFYCWTIVNSETVSLRYRISTGKRKFEMLHFIWKPIYIKILYIIKFKFFHGWHLGNFLRVLPRAIKIQLFEKAKLMTYEYTFFNFGYHKMLNKIFKNS